MRIVIIADFAEASGGAQSVAIQSAAALAAQGVAVTYLHGTGATVDPRLARPGIEHVGLGQEDVWSLSAPRGAVAGIWNRAAARRLAEVLASLPPGPTILHLHHWTRSLSRTARPD